LLRSDRAYYDLAIFNTAISFCFETVGIARWVRIDPTRFYNRRFTGRASAETAGDALQAGDMAVRKNGYSNQNVATIRIDVKITSLGVGLADPCTYTVPRDSDRGFEH
jgi:hypothetical protein